MNDAEIDKTILSTIEDDWRKVAWAVSAVGKTLGVDGEADFQRIAKRIEYLAEEGFLAAQGNLSKWRHSEIRKP